MTPPSPDPYLGKVITAFEGAISTHVIEHPKHPGRAFAYEVTFLLRHPRLVAVASKRPPLHFHPYQDEYIEVLEGRLAVEVEGKGRILEPRDGEFCFRRWQSHRLYSPVSESDPKDGCDGDDEEMMGEAKTRFLLSGQNTDEPFRLDTVFFENWYAYQDQIVVEGEKVNLIQVLSMFDAGGSYLSFPSWIPFGKRKVDDGLVVGVREDEDNVVTETLCTYR